MILRKDKRQSFLLAWLFIAVIVAVTLVFVSHLSFQYFFQINDVENTSLHVNHSYVIDKDVVITFDNVLSHDDQFQSMQRDVTSFGPQPVPIWIKIEIENRSDNTVERVIDTGSYLSKQANIYKVTALDQLTLIYQHEYPRKQTLNYVTPNVATLLNIAPRERMTLLIQYQSLASTHLHLALLKKEQALSRHFIFMAATLCAATIMITQVIFAFIVYWVLGQRKYMYFAFQELCASLTILNSGGLIFLFASEHDAANVALISIALSLIINIFSQLFGEAFLTSIKPLPLFSKTAKAIQVLLALMLVLFLIPSTRTIATDFGQPLLVLSILNLAAASGYIAFKGYREALFYFMSWISMLVGMVYFMLVQNDIIVDEKIPHYMLVQLVFVLQSLLMALGLWLQMSRMGKAVGAQQEQLIAVYHERTKEAEQVALLSSQRNEAMLDAFDKTRNLVSVSHDINNYIAVIKHSLSGSANKSGAPIEGDMKRAMDSLDHLKDFSAQVISSNPFDTQTSNDICNIEALFSVLQKEYQTVADNQCVQLRFSGRVTCINISEVLIKRIFDRLISNALKCTSQGLVHIAAWQDDDATFLQVMDSGKGILEKDIKRLTLAFKQEETSMAGFGLDLFIVKNLSDLLNAQMCIEKNRRVGMNIKIKIPI